MSPERQETSRRQPRWNFDIDRYINPFVLPSRTATRCMPSLARRFLGHHDHPPQALGNLLVIAWAVVGTLAALSLIYVVCGQITASDGGQVPPILGSFGAAAVLEFYATESPLSQPRNMVLGQLFSSLIGVGIHKGFNFGPMSLSPSSPPAAAQGQGDFRWLAGSVACACSIVAMGLTGSVHPPAGATALLAVTDDGVARLGWALVPLVLAGCALMLLVALLVNNVQRTFPASWWTAAEEGDGAVGSFWAGRGRGRGRRSGGAGAGDGEKKEMGAAGSNTDCERASACQPGSGSVVDSEELEVVGGGGQVPDAEEEEEELRLITMSRRGICMPPDVHLTAAERLFLEEIRKRL